MRARSLEGQVGVDVDFVAGYVSAAVAQRREGLDLEPEAVKGYEGHRPRDGGEEGTAGDDAGDDSDAQRRGEGTCGEWGQG